MKDDDVIELYPSEELMDNWKNGVPLEEVKKRLQEKLKDDDVAYRLGAYIAEEFYKKWDADGFIEMVEEK